MTTEAPPEHFDEVRARLEARGLLRTSSQPIVLPEVALQTIVLHDAGDADAHAVAGTVLVAGAPVAEVRCPGCGTASTVGVNRTGFECRSCLEGWRWAICSGCDRMAVTHERQETWRCRSCDAVTRAWWRTTLPTDEPSRIIRRRAETLSALAADAAVVARVRSSHRRAMRMTAALVAVLVVLAGVMLLRSANGIDAGAPCGQFDRLVGRMQTGAIAGPDVGRELESLAEAARDVPALASAARAMVAASKTSTASTEFAVARTQFQDVCRGG